MSKPIIWSKLTLNKQKKGFSQSFPLLLLSSVLLSTIPIAMEVKWMDHRSKKILVVDYTGIKLEREMISLLNQVPPLLKDVNDETLLVLADITGCFMTPGFLNASKQMEKELVNNFKTKRAILGVTGAKVILLKAYNMIVANKLVPFTNREDALNYLTQE